jgi:nicotinate dehydrogenase subunit A
MTDNSRSIQFSVNGQEIDTADADSTMSLLDFLRDSLGLTRTRFGCGAANCGACTVLCNGQPVKSCDKTLADLNQALIETPESLGSVESCHPIMAKLIEHQAVQCGYCISGIAMRMKSFIDQNKAPTKESLDLALDNHLCRCGTHVRIKKAMQDLMGIEK